MAALTGLTGVPVELLQGGRGEGSGSEGADSYEADSESGISGDISLPLSLFPFSSSLLFPFPHYFFLICAPYILR